MTYGTRARYLAGGSDLLVHKPASVEVAVDIRHAGIGAVREEDGGFVLGGAALLRDVDRVAGGAAGGMFGLAVRNTAPWLIRNAATLAGNVANASPAADGIPALLALDAELVLLGETETRVPLDGIFEGPHRTTLGDRLILEMRIPASACRRAGAFIKLARSKSDIAQVNLAVSFRPDGEMLRDVRIALGAVAPVPMRASEAERMLEGRFPDPETLQEAGRCVEEEVRPISDWRASEAYRRRMSGVLVRRAIESAVQTDTGVQT